MTNEINLTDLEKTMLVSTIAFWNYGDETEKEDNCVIFSANDLAEVTNFDVNTCKGVMGSLHKKGLFDVIERGVESGLTDEGIDAALHLRDMAAGGKFPIAD